MIGRLVATQLVALTLAACAAPGGPTALSNRIDNVPMYGQPELTRPESLKRLDEDFIREAVSGLGSREKASDIWWAQAEEFFAQGNLDLAMRRYNQSWLLNPASFKPYWGFGRVLLESRKPDDAIAQFERAGALVNDKYQEPALLTDFGNAYVVKARSVGPETRALYFSKADALYDRALALDPDYANAWKRYAMSMYHQGKYAEAWTKLAEARKRPGAAIPEGFVRDLRNAMPEPK
jgi:tetratricopeptide (TPR) repeat protein